MLRPTQENRCKKETKQERKGRQKSLLFNSMYYIQEKSKACAKKRDKHKKRKIIVPIDNGVGYKVKTT